MKGITNIEKLNGSESMKKESKVKKYKRIMLICVLIFLIAVAVYLIPIILDLTTAEGQILFKQKVSESGIWGMLMIFGLMLAHIFLIIIPGEPIEILAGMCYGGVYGTIFIMTSSAIISILIYSLVKKYGKKFVYEFYPKEKVEKIEKSKILQNPKVIEEIILILFLIPGTPKDLLVYVGGLLPIKPLNFILIATFGRFPSVISSTMAGESIVAGNWKTSIIIYAITFLIVGIAIIIMNKFNKTKVTKEVIDTIK